MIHFIMEKLEKIRNKRCDKIIKSTTVNKSKRYGKVNFIRFFGVLTQPFFRYLLFDCHYFLLFFFSVNKLYLFSQLQKVYECVWICGVYSVYLRHFCLVYLYCICMYRVSAYPTQYYLK